MGISSAVATFEGEWSEKEQSFERILLQTKGTTKMLYVPYRIILGG